MTVRRGRVLAAVTAAVALALACGLTAAYATRIVKIASHISIKSKGLTFSGRVTASRAPCKAGRKVTLLRTNGNVLGSTRTNSAGHWKITAQGSAGITLGRFFARVKKRSDGTLGTIFVCKAAKSKTIKYHKP
jgi:hypothetical protein